MASFTLDDLINIQPSTVSRDLSGYISYIYGEGGVGKAQPNSTVIPTPSGFTLMGDLKPGDEVYGRDGAPTRVLEVFPRGELDVYRVTLEDGRSMLCNDDHIFSVYSSRGNLLERTVRQMLDTGLTKKNGTSRYSIPMNRPLQKSKKVFPVDPYVVGVFLGDGCCLERQLTLSSSDEELVHRVADKILECSDYHKSTSKNYSWTFNLREPFRNAAGNAEITKVQTKTLFKDFINDICVSSDKKRIPRIYFEGSIEQRMELLRGLLDTDGCVTQNSGGISFTSISVQLIKDVQELANSLGFKTSIVLDNRSNKYKNGFCARVNFNISNSQKYLLFNLERKREIALKYRDIPQNRLYERIIIKNIEKLDYQTEMSCILVDNPEHLYITENYIVTHNTTFAKDMGALIIACEDGTHAMSGAYSQVVQSWSDIKAIARYLKDDRMKARYKALAVDTVDIFAA